LIYFVLLSSFLFFFYGLSLFSVGKPLEARIREDYSEVTGIGIDETSKKGHKYVTVVVDLSQRKVIYVTNGKDATTVDRFTEDLAAHKGDDEAIKIVTCDMSLGFKKGINEHFVNSSTVIDKFHVIKHINEALDEVRRDEVKQGPWYKYLLITPMKKFAGLLKNHWQELLNYFDHRYTNVILEGTNSIIQNIKHCTRGFRNDEYFKTMIYLGCGKLDLNIYAR